MSFIQLVDANDHQQYRIAIPLYKKSPPNPQIEKAFDRVLGPPSETVITNSELTPEPREDKNLRCQLLAADQLSFLTGSAAADLQAAHIINPVRRNADRKQAVEKFLSQQKVSSQSSFRLDSVENAILLEANHHVQWDLYGSFCFVPTEEDANNMLSQLRTSNRIWQHHQLERYTSGHLGNVERPLDISLPPFSRPLWEIVILHPHALLPNGQPLAIVKYKYIYHRGRPPPPPPSWKFWVASGDRLSSFHNADDHPRPFLAEDARTDFSHPSLSSLAMVINAHCKLEQFLEQHGSSATQRVRNVGRLMSELVWEIFFVPHSQSGYVSVAGLSLSLPIQHPTPSQAELRQYPTTSTVPGYSQNRNSHEVVGDPTVEDAEAPSPVSMPGRFQAMDPAMEDDCHDKVEAPEIPDTDGLTNSEFQSLVSKANDPYIDFRERAQAAIMMIFGTRRYADPD